MVVLASALAGTAAPSPVALVICAPGYPGSTKEAQPSMDTLAGAVSKAAGWPAERLSAVYYEGEDAGVARLKAPGPSIAMVPLPFYLRHASDLALTPRAQAVEKGQKALVTWSLVAKKGRVTSSSALSGFTIVSLAAYAPDFIRNVALSSWGALPSDVRFSPSGQVLSALRKAADGDPVAVLMDAAQTNSFSTLPFAAELDIVATSPALPGIVVCSVGTSVGATPTKQLVAGMLKMKDTPEGAAALDAVRMASFVPLDAKAVASARASYAHAGPTGTK